MEVVDSPSSTIWTIGHSNRPWEVFVAMLQEVGIGTVVDVRRFAGSRRHPQFSGATMGERLATAGIAYVGMPDLGGRRKAAPGSRNMAWRNASFRGYADWMASDAYRNARTRLAELAKATPTSVMCAEALWWQCHRGLIADDLKAAGWDVIHLQAPGRREPHPYTSAAQIVDGELDYSGHQDPQGSLF